MKNLFLGDEAPKDSKRKPAAARGINKLDRSGSKARMRQSIKHAAESLAKKKRVTVGANFKVCLRQQDYKAIDFFSPPCHPHAVSLPRFLSSSLWRSSTPQALTLCVA